MMELQVLTLNFSLEYISAYVDKITEAHLMIL